MRKLLLVFVATMVAYTLSAQQNIKLTVSGQGLTKEEATASALRSAIEQAFGVFVSANTQILNDEIIKDEIATISSGNIKEYQELGCVTLPSGDQSVTLAATVSLSNLISYSKSKGSSAEFAGATFTMNMRMRKLNAENEITALYTMLDQLYMLAPSVFDWELEVGEPRLSSDQKYDIPMIAKAKNNKSTAAFFSVLLNTLESLSLSQSEIEGYKANNMEVHKLMINDREFVLRNDYRAFVGYVNYLINSITESFQIYGQFGDEKAKLFYDLKEMYLAFYKGRNDEYDRFSPGMLGQTVMYTIKNLDKLMNEDKGGVVFQRDLSVSLDENALYKLYGFEVVPAPNVSRLTFVCNNGVMDVDKMEVYQSVDFWPYYYDNPCKEALKQMRELYVSEDCSAKGSKMRFDRYPNLQTVTVERLSDKDGDLSYVFKNRCGNLETVRIGKGVKSISNIFGGNPNLSTVIIGSTLTFGEEIIDLMSLTDKEVKDIVIFGDGLTKIDENSFSSTNSLSVVINRDVQYCSYQQFTTSSKCAIWLSTDASDLSSFFPLNYHECKLILLPKEFLSDFQSRYGQIFSPLENKMSESGCTDLLSLLKVLCR